MSYIAKVPINKFNYTQWTQAEIDALHRLRVKFEKEGHPVAFLAELVNQQQLTRTLEAERLTDPIIERGGGLELPRAPDGFVSPATGRWLPIAIEEREEGMARVEVNLALACTTCKIVSTMHGWLLASPPGEPAFVVQCPSCGVFHFGDWAEEKPDNG